MASLGGQAKSISGSDIARQSRRQSRRSLCDERLARLA
jgi:hypothetical protein